VHGTGMLGQTMKGQDCLATQSLDTERLVIQVRQCSIGQA